MSDREPIDSLQIEIESSSTDASKSLDALVSSLKKLDRIGKSNSFLLVKKRLKGIAEVQFDTLDKQLRSITKNIKTLEIYKKALKNLEITTPKIDTTSVTEAVDKVSSELERVAEPAINSGEVFGGNQTAVKPVWLEDIQNECDEIVNSFDSSVESITAAKAKLDAALSAKQSNFSGETAFVNGSNFADTFSDKMAKLELQATILTDKMNKLAEADKPDPTQWNMLEKQLLAVRLQYQAIEQQTKKNASAVEELGNKSVKTKGFLGKMFDKFKNVAFYRIVRSLIAQLTRGISAGLQNIAKFSQETNSVMSAYKTEFTYMQNSLGAALLPILQSLLPTITRISDGLVDITNSIGKVSAAINGQKTFLQAKKYAQSYADALDEVKRSTVGFDELNILGNNSATQNDTSQMFEKVDISGWDVAGSIAKIAAVIASLTALISLIKGVKLGTVFTKMGKGIGTAYKYLKNASVWKKAGISIAALATEAAVCYTSIYDMARGTKSVGAGLLALIPICAAVGVAMYAMWGPVGLIIGAVVAVISGVAAGMKAVSDNAKDREMEKFWQISGVAIDDCSASLDNYFRSLGIGKQQEWNEALEDANGTLTDAIFNYNTLFASIQGDNISTKKISELSEAFNTLADAANAVNRAAIGGLMASIKTGIEMNITPELTTRLSGLINSLETAQDLLNTKIQGINAEYQKLLNEIASNGGNVTSDQRKQLEDLRAQMNKFTLSDNTAAESWNLSLQEAKNKGINAGFNKDDVASALDDLVKKRDEYLKTLQTNYASSVGTLKQMIELDKTEFGGALGFSDNDLAILAASYNAQLEEVNKQFNNIVEGVYNGLNANAMKDPSNGWKDVSAWIWNWGYYGEKSAYKEQQSILDMIKGYLGSIEDKKVDTPEYSSTSPWKSYQDAANAGYSNIRTEHEFNRGNNNDKQKYGNYQAYLDAMYKKYVLGASTYATGGFPEDGLFFANHSEMVGKFSNGKTAVANNEQIVEGIKRGVSEAMSESNGNGGGSWIIQVVDVDGNIKGEKIVTAAERKNRRDGKTVISIGG
mgnify:CR=1 FL=1